MSGELGNPGNGGGKGVDEAAMIKAIAENLAIRFGLDLADGKLLERPVLMLLFMNENLLNRVELLEDILEIKKQAAEAKVIEHE